MYQSLLSIPVLTSNQKEVLIALSHGARRFKEILDHFEKKGLKISHSGLTKTLRTLKKNYIVDLLVNGKKVYQLTDAGIGYLDKYYWPLLEEMNRFDRNKWLVKIFENFTDVNQLFIQPNITKQRAFYIVPLSLELHGLILTALADSIISGKLMSEEPSDFSDIYMVTKIKMTEVEKIAKAFDNIWNSHDITVENLFDIVSNLIAHQPYYMRRSIVASLAGMLAVTSIEKLSKDQRRKMRDIDRKFGELIFGRLNLLSDLDPQIIDVFFQDIDAGKDPMGDKRLGEKLIRKIETPEGKMQMFSNLMIDYLNAAMLKKRDRNFIMKVYDYQKGTQGLLIRSIRYEIGVKN